jgi:hypothetical protein
VLLKKNFSSKSLRRCIFIALAVICLFGLPGFQTALAQGQGAVKLAAMIGLDGYCKDDRWIPLNVIVENSGPDVNAQIQVIDRTGNNLKPFTSAELSLPGTSRKELFMSLYPQNFYQGLRVRVVADGQTLAETDLTVSCLGVTDTLIGLVTDAPVSYDALGAIKPLSGVSNVARLNLANLPDQATGWAGLDALVISGVDTNTLSSAQRQAMELWVADGGKLFVVGGAQWQAVAAGLGELLPISLNGTQKVSNLDALGQYFKVATPGAGETTLAIGTLQPKSSVLVEQAGTPLLVEKIVGFGQVFFFAADPGLQPLSQWDGMRVVYETTLTRKSFNVWDTTWDTNTANQALAVLPVSGMPSIPASCIWMLAYLLVIGPANYFFLRRIKRMELAWVTIPALVIVFTLITYGIGASTRGLRPIVNRLGISFSWDGVSQSQVRGLVGVYSPGRAKYNFDIKSPFVVAPLDSDGLPGTLQQGSVLLVPDVAVEIGGLQSFGLDGSQPALALTHDLSFNLTSRGVELVGSITNKTAYTIESANLRVPGDSQDLGDFAPGETRQIKMFIQDTSSALTALFTNAPYNSYGYLGQYGNTDDVSYRRSLLAAALLNKHTAQTDWGVYVMGWVKNESVQADLRDNQFDALDTNLVFIRLNPTLGTQEDINSIPNSFMLHEASSDSNNSYGGSNSIYVQAGGYFVRFWPAIPVKFSSVKELRLHQDIDTSNNGHPLISVWNYTENRWDPLADLTQTEINIPNPDQHVGPGGEIRLELDTTGQKDVTINRLDFELTVNR